MVECPSCHTFNAPSSILCDRCGTVLPRQGAGLQREEPRRPAAEPPPGPPPLSVQQPASLPVPAGVPPVPVPSQPLKSRTASMLLEVLLGLGGLLGIGWLYAGKANVGIPLFLVSFFLVIIRFTTDS